MPGAVVSLDPRSLRIVAQQIRVDAWTAEAISTLSAAGIGCLLLKGPVIARWLYADELSERSYVDADLLIAPGQLMSAQRVLGGLGYARVGEVMPPGDLPHAHAYERAGDLANVDLHRVPHGMQRLSEAGAWAALTQPADTLCVAGVTVTIPGEIARTLLLALHINPTNDRSSRAGRDLRRAVVQLPDATWHQAAALAHALGLEAEMGYRLSVIAEAEGLVRRLGLPAGETSSWASYRTAGREHPRGTLSLLAIVEHPTRRAQARYVMQKLFPPVVVLLERDPLAGRGRRGLVLARLRWWAACGGWLPGAVRGWAANRPRRSRPRR